MRITQTLIALIVSALVPTIVAAQSARVGSVHISNAWARATVPGMQSGGGFLVIENAGADDRLLSATAEVADHVELHTMRMDGAVMKMSRVDSIPIPAGQRVELKPGSYHIMFVNLKAPLQEGAQVQLHLTFEKAGNATLVMPVRALASGVVGH